MKMNEHYYFWCCEWCDTENLVLWARLQEEASCGACHRPMFRDANQPLVQNLPPTGRIEPFAVQP